MYKWHCKYCNRTKFDYVFHKVIEHNNCDFDENGKPQINNSRGKKFSGVSVICRGCSSCEGSIKEVADWIDGDDEDDE